MSDYLSRSARKRPRDDYEEFSRGTKRGRYSDPGPRNREPESPEQKLESLISRLGEKGHKSIESNLETLSGLLITEVTSFKDKILQTICKCVMSMREKRSIYSNLVGLLNAKKFDIGEQMLDLIVAELKSALTLSHYNTVRHLVCFLADLVNCRVVSTNSIVTLFDTFVTVTFEPDIPQVRSDCYVYMVLSALATVGAELEERKRQELERLLITIDNYMSKRATPYLPMFQVWTSDQPYPQRDYLELLWTQVKALRGADWKSQVLLNLHLSFQDDLSGAYLHSLPNIAVPNHTPSSTYPLPYAVFRLFSASDVQYPAPSTTLPPAESVDRFIAEDTVSHILASHEENRKECASALMGYSETARERLQLSADYVITEVLFGHILQLPHPPQVLVYYSSVLIELCKNSPAVYPQLLSQTTELLFSRLESMNTIAINRFAVWFAHHLSNFKYQWDWISWAHMGQQPSNHPSVKFISEVFSKCIRLACYEDFVEQIPEGLSSLLPPEPHPHFKYSQDNGSTGNPEGELAARLLEAIKNKESMDNLKDVLDSLSSVGAGHQTLSQTKMAVLTQCVLKVGCKTITHCFLALVKFRPLLKELANEEDCKTTCLKAVAEFYTNNSQLHGLVIDKLLRMGVVDPLSVVNWLFSGEVVPRFTRQAVWQVLDSTISKASDTTLTAKRELRETKEKLKKVSELDEVAMGGGEREGLEGRLEELEDRVEEGERLLRDVFLAVFERLVDSLGARLDQGDPLWIQCTLDHMRQLLVKNCAEVAKMASLLEDVVFTSDLHPRLLDVFQQFQALL